jgi:hypothetical protein
MKIYIRKQKVLAIFLILFSKFYLNIIKFILDTFPIIFEGFRFTVNKGLSSHFQASHALTLSSVVPSVYKFGATYIGTKQVSPVEVLKKY